MNLTKLRKSLALPLLGLCATTMLVACSDDDNVPNPSTGEFVVSLALQGNGNTFTYYTVPFEDVMSGTLSAVGQGIEQPGYFDFTQIDNTIYSIGGLDDVNVVGITRDANGELKQIGNVSFTNSLKDIVKADANTLVGVEMDGNSDVIKFHTFNTNTLTVKGTETHQVAAITNQVAPSYAGMRISNGYLYLAYYISDPSTFNTPSTDKAEIAVFTYPALEFVKVMEDTRVGPIGGFNTKSGLIKDEQGNIYAVSHSNPGNGYSQSTKPAGIIRINSGQTTIDETYFFDVAAVTGGKTISHMLYLGNGKVFVEVNTTDRPQQERWKDSPLKSAVIDLNTKAITYIQGLPEHSGLGRRLSALHDGNNLYVAIPEGNKIYMYRINLENNTATKGAEIQANFVAGISKL
ncbi:DUF4374 domain-containing protein [Pontibacter sp. 172403-2]|uniref:DUF4374 domain-containing protein n=1 Tax=Pontibacter rufus TaxID=2791028 RepID=UPI0018AFFFF4|nr:DUF4374 domain-containing protein [Pontibacter sp. 172403-2]MBF9252998.1 DUF4374 domain-containing protein [Pontibacter sp. 172403-2]